MIKIITLVFLLMPATLLADWRIETFTHAATQSLAQSATVRNEEGFELAIFKTTEDIIWLDFSLSDYGFDELNQTALPIFQIDNHKPVQMIRGFVATIVPADEGIEAIVVSDDESISTDRDFSMDHIVAERLPERVICPIFQGDHRAHLGTVEALSTGAEITFSYTLLDGTTGKTAFTLKGAKNALNTILN